MFDKLKKTIIYALTIQKRAKKHQMTAYSGQMAYFFVLSIFPLLIFTFSVLSKLNLNFNQAYLVLQEILPPNISELIIDFIKQTLTVEGSAVLSISGIMMIYSSSRAVSALQRAINAAHGFEEKRNFLINKLYGMLYTLMFIALIIISIMIPSLGSRMILGLNRILGIGINLQIIQAFNVIRNLLLPLIYIVVIGSIFKYLPNKTMPIRSMYKGALFAIVASIGANYAFSTIVVRLTDYSILYGSLSAMIAFMIWLYTLGTIMMLGAEINAYELEKSED